MPRSLYLPVHLHAKLVLPGAPATNPPALDGGVFNTPVGDALAQGVHLHWALPDALTRGHIDGNALQFPALPDRWLVLRFATVSTSPPAPGTAPARRSCKAFALDAKLPGTLQPLGAHSFAPERESRWLTALGLLPEGKAIDPVREQQHLEAAYYATSKGRFGCHDDLADLGAIDWTLLHLSYLVIGHYTAPSEDPLTRAASDIERNEWLERMRLHVDLSERSIRQQPPLAKAVLAAQRPLHHSNVSIPDFQGFPTSIDDGYFADAIGGISQGPRTTNVIARLEANEESTRYWRDKISPQVGGATSAIPMQSEDIDAVPSRLVCHGAVVDVGSGGAYWKSSDTVGQSVSIVESVNAAIDNALLNIGGAEVLSLLREGLDGDVTSAPGRQALGHLLHASSFDGAPDTISPAEYDHSLVIRDPNGTAVPPLPQLPPQTPVRIVDRRAIPDAKLPLGVLAVDVAALVASLGNSVRVEIESRLRSNPRWYRASSPIVQLSGQGRGFRHGHDGRMRLDGRLLCRAGGQAVSSLALEVPDIPSSRSRIIGKSLVDLGLELSVEPAFVRELIYEHVLLDPTNARQAAAMWMLGAIDQSQYAANKAHEAFLRATEGWWASADPTLTTSPPAAAAFNGTLPAPIAVTPWSDPWLPLFADIEYQFTSHCANSNNVELGPVDTQLVGASAGSSITLQAREVLSSALSTSLASAIDRLSKELTTTPAQRQTLGELARSFANLDLLTIGFGDLDPSLRQQNHAYRGGELRINKLRLVDAFGVVRTLVQPGSPHKCTLPPRLTHWARVQARMSQADAPMTSTPAPDADPVRSPVAGYLVYDAVEHAIEFFNRNGEPLGQLRHDRITSQAKWEGAPGRSNVTAIDQPILAIIDQALRAGPDPGSLSTETALMAALSVFSTARQSMAPRQASDDHLAMLCGRPIVVLRSRFDVQLANTGASDQPAAGNPTASPSSIRVRLGSLDQADDGVLGFFMYSQQRWRLHVVPYYANQTWDPYQVVHPLICKDTTFELSPNQPREVILLLDGISAFHVQTGLLPRKRIDTTELVPARVMSKILPTLRVGPLLLSESMPRIATAKFNDRRWSFVELTERNETKDTFHITPLEAFAPSLSELPDAPLRMADGWLRLDGE